MKFSFERKPKPTFSINGRKYVGALLIYEGEQMVLGYQPPAGVLVAPLENAWRPEGEPIPAALEPIPGYRRPANWRALEARANEDLLRRAFR